MLLSSAVSSTRSPVPACSLQLGLFFTPRPPRTQSVTLPDCGFRNTQPVCDVGHHLDHGVVAGVGRGLAVAGLVGRLPRQEHQQPRQLPLQSHQRPPAVIGIARIAALPAGPGIAVTISNASLQRVLASYLIFPGVTLG